MGYDNNIDGIDLQQGHAGDGCRISSNDARRRGLFNRPCAAR
ncbi:hypothetical protein ACNKHM_01950 [Shigella sonnei]